MAFDQIAIDQNAEDIKDDESDISCQEELANGTKKLEMKERSADDFEFDDEVDYPADIKLR